MGAGSALALRLHLDGLDPRFMPGSIDSDRYSSPAASEAAFSLQKRSEQQTVRLQCSYGAVRSALTGGGRTQNVAHDRGQTSRDGGHAGAVAAVLRGRRPAPPLREVVRAGAQAIATW